MQLGLLQKRGLLLIAVILMSGLLSASMANAAEKKDKSARRIQQMMQKFEQEKADMQAQFDQEKAALQENIKKSELEVTKTKASLGSANRKNKALSAQLEVLQKDHADTLAKLSQTQSTLDGTRKQLADMTQQYQTAQQNIRDGDAQRKELITNLSKKGKQVIACDEKNARLHDFGLQLIKIYDKPSTYEAILRTESFSQLKRVELENILQDYRDKLDEQQVDTEVKPH